MDIKRLRLLLKSLVFDIFILFLQWGGIRPVYSGPFQALIDSTENGAGVEYGSADILKSSQISYRAEGGFTGVQSYGVILSCVNGHISVMKSIYDPRLSSVESRTREITTMRKDDYLRLWSNLDRQALFKMKDAPQPKMEIADEFTIHFYAKIGDQYHQFGVYGISQPVAARYFALRKLIDDSVHMQALWDTHQHLARQLGSASLSGEKAN